MQVRDASENRHPVGAGVRLSVEKVLQLETVWHQRRPGRAVRGKVGRAQKELQVKLPPTCLREVQISA